MAALGIRALSLFRRCLHAANCHAEALRRFRLVCWCIYRASSVLGSGVLADGYLINRSRANARASYPSC